VSSNLPLFEWFSKLHSSFRRAMLLQSKVHFMLLICLSVSLSLWPWMSLYWSRSFKIKRSLSCMDWDNLHRDMTFSVFWRLFVQKQYGASRCFCATVEPFVAVLYAEMALHVEQLASNKTSGCLEQRSLHWLGSSIHLLPNR